MHELDILAEMRIKGSQQRGCALAIKAPDKSVANVLKRTTVV